MSKPFRAKFFVEAVQSNYANNGPKQSEVVQLRPVVAVGPESENASFSKYTPSGGMTLTVTNPELWGQMTGEFYIDFTPIESENPNAESDPCPPAPPRPAVRRDFA